MARHIFRYPVKLGEWNKHELSGDPLHVEGETDQLVSFWAHCDFDAPRTLRTFTLVGTGTVVPDDWTYWGTTSRTTMGLIWHLYEAPPTEDEI